MSLKIFLRDRIIFPLIELLPPLLRNKLKMFGSCCFGDGWDYFYFPLMPKEFENVSVGDVREVYSELSEQSLKVLSDYLKYCHLSIAFKKYMDIGKNDSIIVPMENLFPNLQKKKSFEEKVCRQLAARTCFGGFAPESGCYHHGLTLVQPEILEYIKNKFFVDLGAFNGDSAFVLAKYGPEKILAFEPSVINGELCRRNMEKSGIDNVEIIQVGISDEFGTMQLSENKSGTSLGDNGEYEVEVVTVDGFLQQHAYGKIGLIKADLEGMGLKMVKGAVETIKRDRPVLLLAIYHNKDEFMGIYEFLKKNVPDYSYRVEALSGLSEVTLIAWPKEAVSK